MHSPELYPTALRVPISAFPGAQITLQPGMLSLRQAKFKQWPSMDFVNPGNSQNVGTSNPVGNGASKGLLSASNSCKNINGAILEGGSSSSEENKRPSIVHEQKTEEDAEDNSNSGEVTMRYRNIQDQSEPGNGGDCLWSNDVQLF